MAIQIQINEKHETLREILLTARKRSGRSRFEEKQLLIKAQLEDLEVASGRIKEIEDAESAGVCEHTDWANMDAPQNAARKDFNRLLDNIPANGGTEDPNKRSATPRGVPVAHAPTAQRPTIERC